MNISDAKKTPVKDSSKTVYGVLCENLAALHTATSGHPALQQRVADLHANFLVAGDDMDTKTIVATWRANNSTEFNHACQATNYSGGIDMSPQGIIYHKINRVVKQMLGEKEICDDGNKPIVQPPVDTIKAVMTIGRSSVNSLMSYGRWRVEHFIERQADSLQAQVDTLKRDPKNNMSKSLLS